MWSVLKFVFHAMSSCQQGALFGGLDIPHSDKRFSGFKKDEKQLDAEVHHKYIYGGHVADYMRVSAAFLFFLLFLGVWNLYL